MRHVRSDFLTSIAVTSALLLGSLVVATPASATTEAPSRATKADVRPDASTQKSVVRPVKLTAQQVLDVNAISAASYAATRTFDATAALAAGASADSVAGAAAVYLSGGWAVRGEVPADTAAGATALISALAACAGRNGYRGYFFPWGSQFAANSCNTSKLIAAAALGAAGAGVLAGVLTLIGVTAIATPIATVVAMVLGFGAAAMAACQAFSPKSAIYLNVGGSPVASCWGQ